MPIKIDRYLATAYSLATNSHNASFRLVLVIGWLYHWNKILLPSGDGWEIKQLPMGNNFLLIKNVKIRGADIDGNLHMTWSIIEGCKRMNEYDPKGMVDIINLDNPLRRIDYKFVDFSDVDLDILAPDIHIAYCDWDGILDFKNLNIGLSDRMCLYILFDGVRWPDTIYATVNYEHHYKTA